MDKNEIILILRDWNIWDKDIASGFHRERPVSRLLSLLETNQIVTVTGPRRAGKSFILRQAAKDLAAKGAKTDVLMVNLEDPRFTHRDANLLQKVFETYLENVSPRGKPFVFLDEVQEVPGWERWVRYMHELGKARIVVSGSNAALLGRELGTLLTGRHLDLAVFPLSLGEMLDFRAPRAAGPGGPEATQAAARAALKECMESGSYPEVVLSARKREILLSYFEDVLDKDLIKRFKVRKEPELRSLAKFYMSNVSTMTTYRTAARDLRISTSTIEKFSGYLEAAYLVFFLKRFSFRVREQEKSPRKVYAIDTGLANAVGFRFSENRGRLAENLVLLELKRRQALNPGLELYHWKDALHREVDFVLKEGTSVQELIQVCWDPLASGAREREAKNILRASRELGEARATVITDEYEAQEDLGAMRISYQPLWKWLMSGTQ